MPDDVIAQLVNATSQQPSSTPSVVQGSYVDPSHRASPEIPGLLSNALLAIGKYLMEGITQPVQQTMDMSKTGEYNPTATLLATMQGLGAGWKGGLPKGETGVGLLAGTGAKKAPLTALDTALDMAKKGYEVEPIWQKTGWIQGKEGKWRFELDDNAMKLKVKEIPKGRDVFLDEIIDHPTLFENYPQLRQVKVNRSTTLNGYSDGNLYFKDFDKKRIIHEVQHAIQTEEGFTTGGSATRATTEAMQQADAKTPFEWYNRLFGEFESRDSSSRAIWGTQERKTVRPYSSEVEPKKGWIVKPKSHMRKENIT